MKDRRHTPTRRKSDPVQYPEVITPARKEIAFVEEEVTIRAIYTLKLAKFSLRQIGHLMHLPKSTIHDQLRQGKLKYPLLERL